MKNTKGEERRKRKGGREGRERSLTNTIEMKGGGSGWSGVEWDEWKNARRVDKLLIL